MVSLTVDISVFYVILWTTQSVYLSKPYYKLRSHTTHENPCVYGWLSDTVSPFILRTTQCLLPISYIRLDLYYIHTLRIYSTI